MNNSERFVPAIPRPEVQHGFSNDPRPDGVYLQADPDRKSTAMWRITVREGSVVRREPYSTDGQKGYQICWENQ